MQAAIVESFNAPPRFTTFADPLPSGSEQIVTVTAAGLHPIVRALANGTHYGSTGQLPFIPGVDGTGRLADGTRIYFGSARPPYGTFAQKAVTTKGMYIPLPDGLDEATAAGIANPGMSSWAALKFRAKFAAGESVLILGATGIAGKLSVQIAKRLGARRIVAAGRNQKALEELKSLGADAIISLTQEHDAIISAFRDEISENGVDVVLDYVWGAPAEAVLAAISQKGLKHASARIRFIQVGNSAAPTITLPAATLRSSGLELLGSGFGSASLDEIFQAVREFFEVAAKNPFQVSLKAVPLRDIEVVWGSPERDARIVFQP
jgi:NADPH2:quinone reductase